MKGERLDETSTFDVLSWRTMMDDGWIQGICAGMNEKVQWMTDRRVTDGIVKWRRGGDDWRPVPGYLVSKNK